MASVGARTYIWALRRSPQRRSRGRAPGGGQGKALPPWCWKLCSIWSSGGGAKFDSSDRFFFAVHVQML